MTVTAPDEPPPPAVLPVTCPPPLTVIWLIATVFELEACCVICSVNVETPLVGTFVKSKSVMFSVRVILPVLPLAKFIASAFDDEVKATSVSE